MQFKALEDLKPKIQTKPIVGKTSIEIEIYDRILDKRVDEIQKISGETDYNKLIYHFKTPGIARINFRGPFSIFKEIRDGDRGRSK